MSKKAEGTKPKTSLCVYSSTVARLKLHMEYGDTFNGIIDRLIDFYERNRDHVTEDNVRPNRRVS
jgi:hypothetical protein